MFHKFNAILKYTKKIMLLNSNLILNISRSNKNNPLIHHKLHFTFICTFNEKHTIFKWHSEVLNYQIKNNFKLWAIWNHCVTQNYAWFLWPTLGLSLWMGLCYSYLVAFVVTHFQKDGNKQFSYISFF
jgi:hypothetical protein